MRNAVLFAFLFAAIAATAAVPLATPHITPGSYGQTNAFITSNGRQFLIVCAQMRGSRFALTGMRADEQGRPVDRMFVIATDATHPLTPRGVASDGEGYVVIAYTDQSSHADFLRLDEQARITRAGTLPLSTTSIAWGGSAYVAGSTRDLDGIATIIDADGTVVRSTPLVTHLGQPGTFRVWPGTAGNVIATWIADDGHVRAIAAPVPALRNGTYVAPAAALSGPIAGPIADSLSGAVVASSSSESLAVWNDPADGIHAQRLDQNASPAGEPFLVARTGHESSRIAVSAAGSQFLAAYSDSHGVHLSIVSGPNVTPLPDPDRRPEPVPVLLSSGDFGSLLIWNNLQLYGVFLGGGAVPQASESRFYSLVSVSQLEPAAVWCGNEHRVVWRELLQPGHIAYVRVRADGTPIDAEGSFVSDDSGGSVTPSIACSGSNALAVWLAYGSSAFVRGAIIDDSGAQHDAFDVGLLRATVPQIVSDYVPVVVWSGSEYLVAWQSGDTRRINLARVAQDGHVIDAVPQVLQSVAGSVRDDFPVLAWNGSEYLLAWSPTLESRESDICLLRLTRELTPVGTIREVRTSGGVQFPRVIAGDHEWGVAWNRFSTTQYATFFSTFTPELEERVAYGAVATGFPIDLAFTGNGYRILTSSEIAMIGGPGQVTTSAAGGILTFSHGGPPLAISHAISTGELVERLYVSTGARLRAARH